MPYDVVTRYLMEMHAQRERTVAALAGLSEAQFWQRPAPDEWCIGEILDHVRAINHSILRLMRITWPLLRPLGRRRRGRPYAVDYDNVYERPGFPMNVGWIWPPRARPDRPLPAARILADLRAVHDDFAAFYTARDPAVLGHVSVWDPVIGWMNLIQVLRVGLYHDELHFADARALARALLEAGAVAPQAEPALPAGVGAP